MKASAKRPLVIAGVVAVVLVLIGVIAVTTRDSGGDADRPGNSAIPAGAQAEDKYGVARRDAKDVTALGRASAPLVMVEYSDYRCPFCGVFARNTLPTLISDYVQSGKLRYERRDLPVFGPESLLGAMAARAAGEQGKFWEYHEAVYADAPERGHLKIDRERVLGWAKKVGVPDLDRFTKDLDNPDLRAAVDTDAREAGSLGAQGTPAFLIGSTPLFGAQPMEAFRDAIDKELAKLSDEG